MKQALAILGGVLALSGCISTIPDSGPAARREAELRGQPILPPSAQNVMPDAPGTLPNPSPPGAPLNATGTALPGSTDALSAPTINADGTVGANPSVPAPPMPGDTNSGATIGAEAMQALQQTAPAGSQPTPVAPAPIAQQPITAQDSSGPNLAAYALSVHNRPGQSVYKRGGMHLTSTEKACAKYVSADQAQLAFLAAGGPERDKLNLDPDGDGFACGWDPTPFQAARQ
ncbi:hypothetical protein [Thioclava pacifica]|uniref:Excalibur calcium-binding domain-containing protein n=1 Tax=Thioclava pacifica DSM 10166 TaxID=1353537 RepID=A0A074JUI9_9RHOB|nr:hypothetical protein [Thioclava pacifica]KEO53022.1 hypothetical protein TP2_08765 [Thioclava pacifica DSM 10166]